MIRSAILCPAIGAVLMLSGCSSSTPTSPSTGVDRKMYGGQDKMKDAFNAKAKHDEFARDMQKKLEEFDVKYKALEKQASEATGDAKKALDEKVKVVKAKREVAVKKLDELKEANVEGWQKIKDGVGGALDDLKKAIE